MFTRPQPVEFFTGRYDRDQPINNVHLKHLYNGSHYDALDTIKPAAQRYGLMIAEMVLRCPVHHSELR
jgi:hypothetical protein